ncbi:DUF6522 family protein [Sedimentitalea sp. JM2-8]|uniref:DUF6522 family protein n=1 Tax=Sedimentitalea xiamensis TaxID=3050037 RepID=A0ABT7FHK2_9RHOB|nr:DUF6522 family protein [Sedimentitalea xiamensis]MDK3074588.1 DUF6522 family protein [Sedimentitalea xiamensis]
METVTVTPGGFEVDASMLASAFGLDEASVRDKMRAGEITSLCETGIDSDAGRFRLTFRHGTRTFRLTVDDAGRVISRARFDGRSPARE